MKKNRILVLIILIILGLMVYFILTSKYFSINNYEIIENKYVKNQEIKKISNEYLGENIFRFDSKKLEKKLKKNIYIKSVKLKRKLPNTIKINIEEWIDICYLEIEGNKIFVNSEYSLEKNKDRVDLNKIPKLIGVNNNILKINNLKRDSEFYSFLKELKDNKLLNLLSIINVEDRNNIVLKTKKDIIVKYGDFSGFKEKSEKLYKVINEISTKSINASIVDISDVKNPFIIKSEQK